MNGKILFVVSFIALAAAGSARAQIANTATGSSSGPILLLGNNTGGSTPQYSGAPLQPYSNYGGAASTGSGPTFAELMSQNSQDMADTGTKLANERAAQVEQQMDQMRQQQLAQQQQSNAQSPYSGASQAAAPVVLQYTPPDNNTAVPPRTFHID